MLSSYYTVLFAFGLTLYGRALSLECSSCSGVQDMQECNTTRSCSDGQVCYKKREYAGKVQFDLGCVDKQHCGEYAKIPNGTIGVRIAGGQTHYCYECCSTENCNRNLCDLTHHSSCVDDELFDCARLNSMFSICKNIEKAKQICPKYCKLCHVVDGNWSPWTSWSGCDVTCENGTRSRARTCTNPAPQYGGLNCSGDRIELKTCQRQLCPVHGGWSEWVEWTSCSTTCGVGMQSHTRTCTNPVPNRFGDHCFGQSFEVRLCYPGQCAIHGGWSKWVEWSTCPATCGVGIQSRNRTCTNPIPDRFGDHCFGQSFEVRLCYAGKCTNVWSDWQPWGSCSEDCVGGVRTRSRTCSNPSIFVSKGTCPGNSTDIASCGHAKCMTDCYDVLNNENNAGSGVYSVTLWKSKQRIQVYCDMKTDNGGWTVFQYRFNGCVDFYRNFTEYEKGFGNLETEFWLGLKIVQEMASQGKTELRLDLTAAEGTTAYETFQNFYLDEGPNYTLHIDPGTGTAGDSRGLSYHNGHHFSTYDADRDKYSGNCAVVRHGGWWYNQCVNANLNGDYVTPGTKHPVKIWGGMMYYSFQADKSLKAVKMMFRRV